MCAFPNADQPEPAAALDCFGAETGTDRDYGNGAYGTWRALGRLPRSRSFLKSEQAHPPMNPKTGSSKDLRSRQMPVTPRSRAAAGLLLPTVSADEFERQFHVFH